LNLFARLADFSDRINLLPQEFGLLFFGQFNLTRFISSKIDRCAFIGASPASSRICCTRILS